MNNNENTKNSNRIYFLDNIRTFMIFLVVLLHSGLVYEGLSMASSWWIVDDPSTNNLSLFLFVVIDVFVMSMVFFISGYFVPNSIKDKKWYMFVKSKFIRLIVPWIIAVLTLIPLYKVIFLFSRNLPQENWTTYFHWSNGIWSQNWLWFLPVLFLFNVIYLLISRLKVKFITLKKAVFIVFFTGLIYSFFMTFFKLEGWTKTPLLDFQNERLLIYFLFYLLGALCNKHKVFDSKAKIKKRYFVILSVVWIPIVAHLFLVFYPAFFPGKYIFSRYIASLLLFTTFYLSLLGIMYVLITTFRYFFNKQGKISNELGRNTYGVYIIHTVVLGGIALLLLYIPIPSLLKFFILTIITYVVSTLLVYCYRIILKKLILKNIIDKIKAKNNLKLHRS